MEGGREGARGGWGGIEGSEGGSDDARQGDSVNGGLREGGLMKGRNEAWTARGKEEGGEASRGERERGREGAKEGRKLQGRYREKGTYWPVYSIFTNHSTTRPLALRLWYCLALPWSLSSARSRRGAS